MARLYLDIEAMFEFETSLDGAAIPVAIAHLNRLLHEHEEVRGYQLIDAERSHKSMVSISAQLLLEQELMSIYSPDLIGESFAELTGASHDILLQGAPLSLTRLHRARVLT